MKTLKLLKLEIWKAKLCLVCELPAWWKSTQTHLLTNVIDFKRSAVSKTWKCKLYSFFHTPLCPLVKTIQIRLLTKVRAWTIRKLRKWSQFVPITFLNQHCPTIFFKLMSTLLKNSFHVLYRAASSGAQLARVYISISADVMDWSKKIEYLTSRYWISFENKFLKQNSDAPSGARLAARTVYDSLSINHRPLL